MAQSSSREDQVCSFFHIHLPIYGYVPLTKKNSIIHPLWVRTPLITALVEAGKKFRQPILEPEDVSKAVLKQILTQSSGQVIIPSKNTYYSLIRALPNWSQEFLRGIGSRILKDVRDAYAELLKERAGTKTEV